MDILAASDKLSQIDLSFDLDGLAVTVLWFRAMRMEGSWLIRRHMHSSYEFHFVAAGSCRVAHAGGEFTARAGQFYLTGPRVWHEQAAAEENYTEYSINCDITASSAPGPDGRLLYDAFTRTACRPVRDGGSIACFERAFAEAAEQRAGYYTVLRGLAGMILTLAARALQGGGRAQGQAPLKAAGREDWRFEQIRQFVADNTGARITAGDLAGVLYISPRQIGRIILRHTGLSTQQYIRAAKLRCAKELLRRTNLDVSEISARLGFTSVYYFSQFFKREEGFSPTLFRQNVRKP